VVRRAARDQLARRVNVGPDSTTSPRGMGAKRIVVQGGRRRHGAMARRRGACRSRIGAEYQAAPARVRPSGTVRRSRSCRRTVGTDQAVCGSSCCGGKTRMCSPPSAEGGERRRGPLQADPTGPHGGVGGGTGDFGQDVIHVVTPRWVAYTAQRGGYLVNPGDVHGTYGVPWWVGPMLPPAGATGGPSRRHNPSDVGQTPGGDGRMPSVLPLTGWRPRCIKLGASPLPGG
jgi:hypothetical protein